MRSRAALLHFYVHAYVCLYAYAYAHTLYVRSTILEDDQVNATTAQIWACAFMIHGREFSHEANSYKCANDGVLLE